jgi:hypothetical protein
VSAPATTRSGNSARGGPAPAAGDVPARDEAPLEVPAREVPAREVPARDDAGGAAAGSPGSVPRRADMASAMGTVVTEAPARSKPKRTAQATRASELTTMTLETTGIPGETEKLSITLAAIPRRERFPLYCARVPPPRPTGPQWRAGAWPSTHPPRFEP